MFRKMLEGWFRDYSDASCNDFTKALLRDDLFAMSHYINEITMVTFRHFDTGKNLRIKQNQSVFITGLSLG